MCVCVTATNKTSYHFTTSQWFSEMYLNPQIVQKQMKKEPQKLHAWMHKRSALPARKKMHFSYIFHMDRYIFKRHPPNVFRLILFVFADGHKQDIPHKTSPKHSYPPQATKGTRTLHKKQLRFSTNMAQNIDLGSTQIWLFCMYFYFFFYVMI